MTSDHCLYILGLGLIGGSIARGLQGGSFEISGWDCNASRRRRAVEQGAVRDLYPPAELPGCVDGVVLAVPVPEMPGLLEEIVSSGAAPEYVTDVGSTKKWICRRAREILPDSIDFIGGHPMAGSEKAGLEAADPLLFENAICVLTSVEREGLEQSRPALIWEELGAHLMELEPERHDRVVANVSHLPHVVAASLIHTVACLPDYEEDALPLAAGGFRDTTRIAAGDPELWRDILVTNRDELLEGLEGYSEVIGELKALVREENWDGLTEWLGEARSIRETIPEQAKGLVGRLHELRIQAPDKPGILAEITGKLAEASLNICDIEVLRVREGEKGTIRLAFRRSSELEEARRLLESETGEISII